MKIRKRLVSDQAQFLSGPNWLQPLLAIDAECQIVEKKSEYQKT